MIRVFSLAAVLIVLFFVGTYIAGGFLWLTGGGG